MTTDTRSQGQAKAQSDNITANYQAWQWLNNPDECEPRELSRDARAVLHYHGYDGENHDDVREAIEQWVREDALSVEVRSGWFTPGNYDGPEEYCILLCTGGPAVRITGGLNQYGEPGTATVQHQDWFKPWADYDGADEDALLWYAGQFYHGEG